VQKLFAVRSRPLPWEADTLRSQQRRGQVIVAGTQILGFWTLSIAHNSKRLENTTFRKLDLFPSSGNGRETPTLLGRLERGNLNQTVTSSYLEFRRRDKVHKPSDCDFFIALLHSHLVPISSLQILRLDIDPYYYRYAIKYSRCVRNDAQWSLRR
jgi:hypothetical protein